MSRQSRRKLDSLIKQVEAEVFRQAEAEGVEPRHDWARRWLSALRELDLHRSRELRALADNGPMTRR